MARIRSSTLSSAAIVVLMTASVPVGSRLYLQFEVDRCAEQLGTWDGKRLACSWSIAPVAPLASNLPAAGALGGDALSQPASLAAMSNDRERSTVHPTRRRRRAA